MTASHPILAHDGTDTFSMPASDAWPRLQALHHHALLEGSKSDMSGASSQRPIQSKYAHSLGTALGQFATSHPELRNSMFESLMSHVDATGSMDGLESLYASGLTDAARRKTHLHEGASRTLQSVGWPAVAGGGLEHSFHVDPHSETIPSLGGRPPASESGPKKWHGPKQMIEGPEVTVGGQQFFGTSSGGSPVPVSGTPGLGQLLQGMGLPGEGLGGLLDQLGGNGPLDGFGSGLNQPGQTGLPGVLPGGTTGGFSGATSGPLAHFTGGPDTGKYFPGPGGDPSGSENDDGDADHKSFSYAIDGGTVDATWSSSGGGGDVENEVGRPTGSTGSGSTGGSSGGTAGGGSGGGGTAGGQGEEIYPIVRTTYGPERGRLKGDVTTVTVTYNPGYATPIPGPVWSAPPEASGGPPLFSRVMKAIENTSAWVERVSQLTGTASAIRRAAGIMWQMNVVEPWNETGGRIGPKEFGYMPSEEGGSPVGPHSFGADANERTPEEASFENMPAPDDPSGGGGPKARRRQSFSSDFLPDPEGNSPGTPHARGA